nr:hypothetical protein [Actinomycetota bacterium]
ANGGRVRSTGSVTVPTTVDGSAVAGLGNPTLVAPPSATGGAKKAGAGGTGGGLGLGGGAGGGKKG